MSRRLVNKQEAVCNVKRLTAVKFHVQNELYCFNNWSLFASQKAGVVPTFELYKCMFKLTRYPLEGPPLILRNPKVRFERSTKAVTGMNSTGLLTGQGVLNNSHKLELTPEIAHLWLSLDSLPKKECGTFR